MTDKKDSKWTPEYRKNYMKEWRRKNKRKTKEYQARWKAENEERLKEYHNNYMKEWRKILGNREKIANYQKEWNKNHPDYHKNRQEDIERQRIADRQKEIEQMNDIIIG